MYCIYSGKRNGRFVFDRSNPLAIHGELPAAFRGVFLRKMWMLSASMLIVLMLLSTRPANAQTVSLSVKNSQLTDVFKEIRKQTGYDFVYNSEVVKSAIPVTINGQNMPLQEVLDKCFEHQPFGYSLKIKTIVLQQKAAKVPERKDVIDGITIDGTVTDEKGQPLAGATVRVDGTLKSAITKKDGSFALPDVSENDVISVSFVGYKVERMKVGNKTSLSIALTPEASDLDGLVVVGYGTQKKSHVTASISTLKMNARDYQPNTNLSQSLHGVPGLWVNQPGGKPGQDVGTIRIRGVGTLNNSNPLVLVDGIEYNMNEVNPQFIENVTVLKDASAAIYGSRAANGVILITTKQGSKGKMKIDYNYSYGVQRPTAMPDVEWDAIKYMELKNQALLNEGRADGDYSPELIENYKQGMKTDPLAYPSVNWFDEVLTNGIMQQHNLSFSGGNEAILYNVALGYNHHDGILIDANNAQRYSFNVNLNAKLTKNLKVGTNIIGNYRRYTEPAQGTNAVEFYFNRLMRALPIYGTYLPDGRYANLAVPTPSRDGTENLIQYLKEGTDVHTPQRLLAKFYADYDLPFGIKYNVNFALDKLDGYSNKFVPILAAYNPQTWAKSYAQPNASAESYNEHQIHTTIYQSLKWEQQSRTGHRFSVMAGQSYEKYDRRTMTARIEGFFDNSLTDLYAGSLNPTANGVSSEDILASYFGRVNYSFKNKYLLEANLRYDGSSRFAPQNRWGLFPAVSAGWRIDKESFFEPLTGIFDLLKLRLSWGEMGNQSTVSMYSYMNTVTLNQDYSRGNTVIPGAAVTSYGDPAISWEKTTSYNAGLDFGLAKNKLTGGIDVFKRRTSDILRTVAIPAQIGGLAGPVKNIGVVENKGFEVNLEYSDRIGPIDLSVFGNLSYVDNKVVDLNGESVISGTRIIKEGYSIDAYYLLQTAGLYQSMEEINNSATVSNAVKPGYIRYIDQNKDKIIDGNDRIITGSSIPKYNYGFGTSIGYKNLNLQAFFQGVQGVNIYPADNLAFPFNNGAGVTKEWETDSWTPENRNARLPILTTATGATENFQNSTYWLRNGSYLRLRNVQFNYSCPDRLIRRLGLQKLVVFVNGQNLLTFSDYKMFDPEKDITNDNLYEYPSLKTVSFGTNLTF